MKSEILTQKSFINTLSKTELSVLDELKEVFGNIEGDKNLMLVNCVQVWIRMRKFVKNLSPEYQYEILREATMIAYDARVSAFDHIINFNTEGALTDKN